MSLSQQEVEHIAKLARLELSEEQKELYREQLSAILDYVAKLRELDTKDVPSHRRRWIAANVSTRR